MGEKGTYGPCEGPDINQLTLEAEAGNAEAQYMLGTCYENGTTVDVDMVKAAYWYTLAADGANPDAEIKPGLCKI